MVALRASTFTPLEAGEPQSTAEVCRVYRFKLTPISAPNPETQPTLSDLEQEQQ